MKTYPGFLCVALCATALSTRAAFAPDLSMPSDAKHLKPGLWETIVKSESVRPPVVLDKGTLNGLDPAARARVEAVMQKQAAARAARGGAPEVSSKTKRECITQAVLDKRSMSLEDGGRESGRDKDCPPVVKSRTASKVDVVASCNVRGQQFHLEMIFEVKSPQEFAAQTETSGNYGGQQSSSKTIGTSRWLGAACGDAPLGR
jgi:hypothetical protein